MVKQISNAQIIPKRISKEPIISNGKSPESLNLGHLSKKIDEILCRAIYEGGRLNLEEGLELESNLFGECMKTKDMQIGLNTFITNGARAKAEFINE